MSMKRKDENITILKDYRKFLVALREGDGAYLSHDGRTVVCENDDHTGWEYRIYSEDISDMGKDAIEDMPYKRVGTFPTANDAANMRRLLG